MEGERRPRIYGWSDEIAPPYLNIDMREILPGASNYSCRGTLFAAQSIALIYGADLTVDLIPAPPLPEENYCEAGELQKVLLWQRGRLEAMKAVAGAAAPAKTTSNVPSIFGRM